MKTLKLALTEAIVSKTSIGESIVKGHISKKQMVKNIKGIDINSFITSPYNITNTIELRAIKKIDGHEKYISKYLDIIQYFFDNYDMSKVKFNSILFIITDGKLCVYFVNSKEMNGINNYGEITETYNGTTYFTNDGESIVIKGNEDKIYDMFCK